MSSPENPVRFTMRLSQATLIALLSVLIVGVGEVAAQTREFFADVDPAAVSAVAASATSRVSTLRSRPVGIDLGRLAAVRTDLTRNATPVFLTLNLFEDTVFSAVVDRTAPTQSGGYVLFGRLEGVEFGTMTLVVNGDVVAGTIRSPAAVYAVRSLRGGGVYVVREVDSAKLLREVEPVVSVPGVRPGVRGPRAGGTSPATRAGRHADPYSSEGTDDGSTIDVVVFYTPAAREAEGGTAPIETLIDLLVAETNDAYERSKVIQRLNLVGTEEAAYIYSDKLDGLIWRLENPGDGFADEVHGLRDVYAADLVHVIVAGRRCAGIAGAEFSATTSRCADTGGLVFAHELGHNMGLWHDRYAEIQDGNLDATHGNRPYPYSYGYVNQRAFEPNAPESARWQTVMATWRQCSDRGGFSCEPVFRFSNPDQNLNGDALGVPGDQASLSATGPADARRSLNNTRRTVANLRASRGRDTCTFALAPNPQFAFPEGGRFEVKVTTQPGCAWNATSNDAFLSLTDGETGRGPGAVTYLVAANRGTRRAGTLSIAGQVLTVHQIGPGTPGICTRTPQVRRELTYASGLGHCWEVTAAHLGAIRDLDLAGLDLEALPAGDLAGLTGLRVLFLYSNRLMTLRADTFAGLTSLVGLTLAGNAIASLPANIFTGLTELKWLNLSQNQLTTIPASVGGLTNLENLYLEPLAEPRGEVVFGPISAGRMPVGECVRAEGNIAATRRCGRRPPLWYSREVN